MTVASSFGDENKQRGLWLMSDDTEKEVDYTIFLKKRCNLLIRDANPHLSSPLHDAVSLGLTLRPRPALPHKFFPAGGTDQWVIWCHPSSSHPTKEEVQ